MPLTEKQQERYSRHLILQEVGPEGQEKLLHAKVLVIGTGGLGSPNSLYLTAAGVGTVGIVDADVVDPSNLQRQIAHSTKDLDRPKVESAAEKMRALNPDVEVKPYKLYINAKNINEIIREYDFVIDGSDNFATKFLVNDACVLAGIPYSHGGILRFKGQTMTVLPGQTACYRCSFREPPPNPVGCSRAGILGAVAGMLGTIQAAEALKFITGAGTLLTNTLLTFDAATMDFRKVPLKKRSDCPVCGENPTICTLEVHAKAAGDSLP
ncbi:MAG: HesA/MoeB/ThiF family protein [Candidatus Electrothrix sp. AW1]|nr:HesA/MoeB/ThiF family protein [Candidatus Electrothrix sp. AX1]MCI5181646.1 HesA/MoeB/ThiF family protein [Candidatus Electrothrix gigas]